jgi:hypothetical protein
MEPLDENEAWERMRAAILRCRADPTEENHAEVRRRSRALTRAMEGDGAEVMDDQAA